MKSARLRRTSALAARPTACLAVLSMAFALLYVVSNRLASGRSDVGAVVFAWEHAIPFVEWTIVPYVSICGFFALSFFVGRDPQEQDVPEGVPPADHVRDFAKLKLEGWMGERWMR